MNNLEVQLDSSGDWFDYIGNSGLSLSAKMMYQKVEVSICCRGEIQKSCQIMRDVFRNAET